jgi:hypothetical protein
VSICLERALDVFIIMFLMTTNLPQFELVNGQVVLTGMLPQAYPLWQESERLKQAGVNVEQALDLEPGTTAVFLGVEHLPILKALNFSKPAIIIEKSRLHHDAFCRRYPISALPEGIKVVVGEWGFSTAYHFPKMQSIWHDQEFAYLGLQLFELPDELFQKTQVFGLAPYPQLLKDFGIETKVLQLITEAKRFHAKNQRTYDLIKSRPATATVCVLLHKFNECLDEAVKKFFNIIGDAQTVKHLQLTTQDDFLTSFLNEKPLFVALPNRMTFLSLEDSVYYEEMLRRMGVPVACFFYEWFTQQTTGMYGGWSYFLYCDQWRAEAKKIFTIFPRHAMNDLPKTVPVYEYPPNYVDVQDTMIPPITDQNQMERDIAIIHDPRIYCVECNEINEIYEMVSTHAPDENGKSIYHFLYLFRKMLAAHPYPLANSFYFRSLVNSLDFLFYNQTRIRNVLKVVTRLKDYRISVYGEGWQNILPKHVACEGHIFDQGALSRIYRTSQFTLDLTQMFSKATPHFPAIKCLAEGGFPLMLAPCLDDRESGLENVFGDHCLYFENAEDLAQRIGHYRSHWDERQKYISQAQSTWLKDIQNRFVQNKFDALNSERLKPSERVPQNITAQPQLDACILEAAFAYVLSMSGYIEAAFTIWQTLLYDRGFHHLPLIVRTLRTAKELQKWAELEKLLRVFEPKFPSAEGIKQIRAEMAAKNS